MRNLLVIVLVLLGTSAAHAQWMLTKEEDAFEGDMHIAGAFEGIGYGVGFRCRDADSLSLIYMTPEEVDATTIAGMSFLKPAIVVIVDSEPKVRIPAELEPNSVTGKLSALGDDAAIEALLFRARAAKKRVAVALEVGGQIFHSKTFSARGSERALGGLAKSCNIEPPQAS